MRLVQIDTPEVGGGECYSQAARKALLRLTPVGSTVLLEADPQLDNVDRYGRLLRYIKRDGVNVNIRLVLDGAAAPYFYRSERGRYAGRFVSAVTQAKTAKRGFWGACPGTQLTMTGPLQTQQGKPTPTTAAATHRQSRISPTATLPTRALVSTRTPPTTTVQGGSGNGPLYTGRVEVVGPDDFGLDRDGDGVGCD